ncbi:FGL1 isoform 10 [Pongo abelii]|uniref:Fibrinogen-like protein 1 n=1 Tax=Pongo abelii TaxID=9601 RepID=A0A2J8X3Z2_PONAB|nr:FGL1 isoform 10 [Pongo abelii]
MAKMFSFILVTTALIMGREISALEDCAQEQVRLRAQVRLLETRVKEQQVKIKQLLQENEVQFLDKGDENTVIDLGSKRQYAEDYTLKIDLADFEKNSRYAQYKNFKVGDEKNFYQLNIGEYSGTAGDSLAGNFHPEVQWWASHQRMKFSTWDRDHDNYEGNCAEEDQSGWWFNRFDVLRA